MGAKSAKTALIGYTGFVGSNLASQLKFDNYYNSKNIEDIQGQSFKTIICAGVSAVKWWANKHPEDDLAQIDRLVDCLKVVECDRFILFSTVDVYLKPDVEKELLDPPTEGLHAYGRNRLYFERFIRGKFKHYHILRLPALFGPGLKKNAIYDLLHSNQLDVINPESSFQWYPVTRLSDDLNVILRADIPLINMAAEPIQTECIRERFFPDQSIGTNPSPTAHYDMRTQYGSLFGSSSKYIINSNEILENLGDYLRYEKSKI